MYKISQSTGKVQVWSALADDEFVNVEHGELGGKMQIQSYQAEAMNIGKVNETTAEEQAEIEVKALYEARYTNKHYRYSIEEAKELAKQCLEPRKVHNYKDYSKKLPEEVYFSVKLNGSRACILDGELYSKIGRKEEIKVDHIREAVKALGSVSMDCEVYAHGLSLQRIRSAWLKPVKTAKEICKVANEKLGLTGQDKITSVAKACDMLGYNPNMDADKLRLFVFDIPVVNTPFKERLTCVEELKGIVVGKDLTHAIDFVDTYIIPKEKVIKERDTLHKQGFEGGVIYDPEDMYEFGKRSYSCQKTKPRLDSEGYVFDCTVDKSGQGVLHLRTNDEMGSVVFKGKMKGDAESRAFEVQKEFVGKWVTYSYEELSDSGKPTKPVVHETRLCDVQGKPKE